MIAQTHNSAPNAGRLVRDSETYTHTDNQQINIRLGPNSMLSVGFHNVNCCI